MHSTIFAFVLQNTYPIPTRFSDSDFVSENLFTLYSFIPHGIMITLIGYYDIEHLILVFVVQLYYFFKWGKKKIEISDLVVLGIAFLLLLLFNSYDAERGAILYSLSPDYDCEADFTICPTKGLGYYCWIISYATLMIGIISDTLFPSPRVIDLFERERIV